jgi:exopolysaccharide biosynthesis polyprenyl glycosylphosphotransferase
MHTSHLSFAHRITYLTERALALPVAIGVMLSADFSRIPNGVANFLVARVTVLHVICAVIFIAAWVFCFPSRTAQRNSGLALLRRLAQNSLGVLVITTAFGLLMLEAHVVTPVAKVLPLFLFAVTVLTTLRMLMIAALDGGFWQDKLNVLVLGTGPIARRAWRDIRTKHFRTAKIIGFVDDQCVETALPEILARYVGTVQDLESTLLKTAVDMIVIAMPTKSCYDSIQAAIAIAEEVGVDVVQFESVFSLGKLGRQTWQPHSAVYRVQRVGQVAAQMFKRMMDMVLSGTGIILLSPLLILIAMAIKVTDPGPALFVQERFGYRRRKFKLFKFRTMVANAERMMADLEKFNEAEGPIFKIKNDPRITPLGRILRKTSLDELPQLLNVLIGDMSLVGPRPMSLRDVSLFSTSNLMRRFNVKPGITGLWQVSGRSNTSFDHWISMDFRYIDDWSFWLDLSILARTIPVVIKGSGAM